MAFKDWIKDKVSDVTTGAVQGINAGVQGIKLPTVKTESTITTGMMVLIGGVLLAIYFIVKKR